MAVPFEEFEVFYWEEPASGRDQDNRPLASAVIGADGGRCMVSDRQSPLHGTVLEVPAGALEAETKIQIREGTHSGSFGIGPSVQLLPDGLEFKYPVELTICHKRQTLDINSQDRSLAFFTYDNQYRQWVYGCHAAGDMQENKLVCQLRQL